MNLCPLCQQSSLDDFHRGKRRIYRRCANCHLIVVPDSFHLSAAEEKAVYDQHQNYPFDPGYRKFLSRTLSPVLERVSPHAEGLDFGCGSGPTISEMAAERGISVSNYDLYYFNRPALLKRQYDFITLTEVIEHVADANALLVTLDALLKPGGLLGIMTKRPPEAMIFADWHYKKDPTHIRFYSLQTFEWMADAFNWTMEVIDADVVFFVKNV